MSCIEIKNCRICENANLVPILDLGEQALTGVFPKEDQQRELTRGPLSLVKCMECGLVQLRHSYELSELYGAHYGYRSGLNQSMVAHLRQKAQKLQQIAQLAPGDCVVDIGSNDGTSLSFYPESAQLFGFDPSAGKFRQYYRKDIRLITDFFSAAAFRAIQPQGKVKIISSIAMFYDLERPMDFVNQIAEILGDDGLWHFEQSYLPSMLNANAYDTVCHEHLEYYALRQIKWMLDRAGLKIVDMEINDINGGSFSITASPQNSPHPEASAKIAKFLHEETAAGYDELEIFAQFRGRVLDHRDELLGLLRHLRAEGKTIMGYGASTKGNVILQFCGIDSTLLDAIAEVNPDKFGCYTPGSRIPIISEAEAHQRKPDYFLVLPWHFRNNLIERERAFIENGGQMIFPLPEIEIVSVNELNEVPA